MPAARARIAGRSFNRQRADYDPSGLAGSQRSGSPIPQPELRLQIDFERIQEIVYKILGKDGRLLSTAEACGVSLP